MDLDNLLNELEDALGKKPAAGATARPGLPAAGPPPSRPPAPSFPAARPAAAAAAPGPYSVAASSREGSARSTVSVGGRPGAPKAPASDLDSLLLELESTTGALGGTARYAPIIIVFIGLPLML
jgi:hypothetical protein